MPGLVRGEVRQLIMFASRVSRIGVLILKQLSGGKPTSISRAGYNTSSCYNQYLQPLFDQQSETKLLRGAIFQKHHLFSTVSASASSNEGLSRKKSKISVTFVDKDGEEIHIKVPTGMSMLEAAHENDIDLEGKVLKHPAGYGANCRIILQDMDYYNKLEEPTDEENDMLDLAFGLTETSRLGCQVIAKPELDGIRLAIPAATRNFAVDGYVPKPH
ncbi:MITOCHONDRIAL FERREDOXIN 2 [Prunus dulcis]|uniref:MITOCHONDRIAL FERREDOXIN 2 n=1 Tax=Prunus dulcis TaxID=3755 RepID=A0A4Y1RSH3_PRUDU|nr:MITOCHONDRIAL FERREDOXIN 2 [Prunus dulcis]